ncbi:hypothetical protein J6590_084766 [Homalodisca vitripennis]|nr:hypothetical protein J6590_084766 [Homalodisca vitripennis]
MCRRLGCSTVLWDRHRHRSAFNCAADETMRIPLHLDCTTTFLKSDVETMRGISGIKSLQQHKISDAARKKKHLINPSHQSCVNCKVAYIMVSFKPTIINTNSNKESQFIIQSVENRADAQVLYFYLPIGVLVFANVTMFSTTSCRLKAHTSNTKVLQTEDSRRHHDNERQRFNLYLKLFVVMGVTWVMELVSFVVGGSRVIWLATDICNALQGLLIFVMFVCKPRILQLIRQRFSPHRTAGSVYSNTRTSMSRLSRSSSSKSSQQYSINPDITGSESKVTIVSDLDEVDLLSSKL